MTYTLDHMRMALRHIDEGERRIADLEQGIQRSKTLGFSTSVAEDALATMRETMVLMREHALDIELSIAGRRSAP